MWIAQTISELRRQRGQLSGTVALVPTMGALHEGHISHMNIGRKVADHVITSIFVNPIQFGPDEDLHRYPRSPETDLAKCEAADVAGVFYPSQEQMYPAQQSATEVTVPSLTSILEGESRTGHFAGVCRVVSKLLNIVQPDLVTFGYKDYQQWLVVNALIKDLNLPVQIQPIETVRDADGTALSSRHRYLSEEGHARAVGLYKALRAAKTQIEVNGETDPHVAESAMTQTLEAYQIDVDYAAVRHRLTLTELDCIEPKLTGGVVALVAGRVDGVRLIDNMLLGTEQ